MVLGKDLRIGAAHLLEQAGRTLDVGEQEGHGAGGPDGLRDVRHAARLSSPSRATAIGHGPVRLTRKRQRGLLAELPALRQPAIKFVAPDAGL